MMGFHKKEVHAIVKNDCGIRIWAVPLFQQHKIWKEEINFEKMFPTPALEKAILHLNKYCCTQKLLEEDSKPCENINSLSPEKWPQSPFLFDHFIDVWLRRLDGINNYDLASDTMSEERRAALTGIMENPDWVVASKIIKTYTDYRTLDPKFMFKKTHLNIQKFGAKEVWDLKTFVERYTYKDEVSLADKYNNICFVARNMYEKKPWEKILIWTDKLTNWRSSYTDCQKMVAQRIRKETTLVRTVIIEQSSKILMENINQTINKHFLQDKLAKLQTTIINIRDLFTTLVKQAPISKKCSI